MLESTTATEDLLTTKHLSFMFDKSPMTIYNWRRHNGMPAREIKIPGESRIIVRFEHQEVKKWARANQKEILRDLRDFDEDEYDKINKKKKIRRH